MMAARREVEDRQFGVVNVQPGFAEKLSELLREGDPTILARVKGNSVYLDLRTVSEHEEETLLERVKEEIGNISGRE